MAALETAIQAIIHIGNNSNPQPLIRIKNKLIGPAPANLQWVYLVLQGSLLHRTTIRMSLSSDGQDLLLF